MCKKASWTYSMLKMILAPVSLFSKRYTLVIGDLNTIAFFRFVCLLYFVLSLHTKLHDFNCQVILF